MAMCSMLPYAVLAERPFKALMVRADELGLTTTTFNQTATLD